MSHGSDLFQGCIDNGENANINHFSTKSEVLTKKKIKHQPRPCSIDCAIARAKLLARLGLRFSSRE